MICECLFRVENIDFSHLYYLCVHRIEDPGGVTIEGDNCCLCHTSALKQSATKDIFYVSFTDDLYEPPFYVAVNHKTRSLVVVIRGALSMRHFLSALTAWPVPLNIPGIPTSIKVTTIVYKKQFKSSTN